MILGDQRVNYNPPRKEYRLHLFQNMPINDKIEKGNSIFREGYSFGFIQIEFWNLFIPV